MAIEKYVDAFFESFEEMSDADWQILKEISKNMYKIQKKGRPKGSKNGVNK